MPLTMFMRAARAASACISLSRASASRAARSARWRSLTTTPTSRPVIVRTSMTTWNSVNVGGVVAVGLQQRDETELGRGQARHEPSMPWRTAAATTGRNSSEKILVVVGAVATDDQPQREADRQHEQRDLGSERPEPPWRDSSCHRTDSRNSSGVITAMPMMSPTNSGSDDLREVADVELVVGEQQQR